MYIRYLLFWIPMILVAVTNGTFRQFVLLKYLDELRAHQLSTVTLIILSTIYVALIFPSLHIQNSRQALLAGFTWLMLTVLFEFSLGRLTNKPWSYLLQDYNLGAGRIWPVFLICLFFMPFVLYLVKK